MEFAPRETSSAQSAVAGKESQRESQSCERELITFDCAGSDSVQQERAPAQSQEMLIAGGGGEHAVGYAVGSSESRRRFRSALKYF